MRALISWELRRKAVLLPCDGVGCGPETDAAPAWALATECGSSAAASAHWPPLASPGWSPAQVQPEYLTQTVAESVVEVPSRRAPARPAASAHWPPHAAPGWSPAQLQPECLPQTVAVSVVKVPSRRAPARPLGRHWPRCWGAPRAPAPCGDGSEAMTSSWATSTFAGLMVAVCWGESSMVLSLRLAGVP